MNYFFFLNDTTLLLTVINRNDKKYTLSSFSVKYHDLGKLIIIIHTFLGHDSIKRKKSSIKKSSSKNNLRKSKKSKNKKKIQSAGMEDSKLKKEICEIDKRDLKCSK